MASHDEVLAARIKNAREAFGISQEGLARSVAAMGLDFRQQTIYKIESGNRKVVASELVAISAALGVPVTELLGIGSDRQPLFSSGARLEEAQRQLQSSALAHGRAMMAYARAADRAGDNLHEVDRNYAEDSLLRQTPGWIASADVLGSIEATLKMNQVDPAEIGPHSRAVLESLRRDHEHFHGESDG